MTAFASAPERVLQRLDWTVVRRLDGLLQGDYRSLFRGTGEREFGGVHPRQRSALAAVGVGVFAGRAAEHRPEVVDEMRLVVPTEADREVGEVDIWIALDLQSRLL